jgi:glycosyltransferase involved in cell wall biosynthesis
MRILHAIATTDVASGGPIEALKATAVAMAALGHETEAVTLDDPGAAHLSALPFRVHPQGRLVSRYSYTPRLAQWIGANASRFDAAVIHGLWNHASVGAWQGLRRAGLPYLVFAHGMLDPWFRTSYPVKHLAKQLFWWAVQGRVLRNAHAVLFTCEEERRAARGAFHGYDYSEAVVALGVAEPPSRSPAQLDAFGALVPPLGQRPYLIFLGRIHPKKGCDLLVEAFARIAAAHPDLDLVVAGPDEAGMKAGLILMAERAGIAERIHWPGLVAGDAKWAALRGAKALILPSHQENFGIVVAEAMACGVPVLISNKVNIWREVEASGAGLVADDSPEGTEALLRRYLALGEAARREMGHCARAAYVRRFGMEGAARELAWALEAAASGGRA